MKRQNRKSMSTGMNNLLNSTRISHLWMQMSRFAQNELVSLFCRNSSKSCGEHPLSSALKMKRCSMNSQGVYLESQVGNWSANLSTSAVHLNDKSSAYLLDRSYAHMIEYCKKFSFFVNLPAEDQIAILKGFHPTKWFTITLKATWQQCFSYTKSNALTARSKCIGSILTLWKTQLCHNHLLICTEWTPQPINYTNSLLW